MFHVLHELSTINLVLASKIYQSNLRQGYMFCINSIVSSQQCARWHMAYQHYLAPYMERIYALVNI